MRPTKKRWVRCRPGERYFQPKNGVKKETSTEVLLGMDEIEAIRLADLEGLSQDEAARRMKVHRSAISRILASAHRKLPDALVKIQPIKVEEGCCKFVKPNC